MSIVEILKLPQLKDGLSIGGLALVVILSLLQISKIPVNPWSAILKWIGNHLNADLNTKIGDIEKKLDKHIEESEKKEISDTRRDILEFCNACMNKRKHTKEQFVFVIKECDEYEEYVEKNHIRNGEITAAIEEIRRLYSRCLQQGDFLKEGEENVI